VGAGLAHGVGARADEKTVWDHEEWDPGRPFLVVGEALRVQPVLMYSIAHRREKASWKSWGDVQSEQAALEEAARITGELEALSAGADFPIEVLPVIRVRSAEDVGQVRGNAYDVMIVYPASGSGGTLQACLAEQDHAILFVRHRSGPVYYWYEALSVRYLDTGDEPTGAATPSAKKASIHDVVVDEYGEVLWRLRALYGVKNLTGSRIVALGGAWGKYAPQAPQVAHTRHGIEIVEVTYAEFEPRLEQAMADKRLVAKAEQWTDNYLDLPNTTLLTERPFVVNAFVLYAAFKALMRDHGADAFTIRNCMGTIMPMAETTACLTLGLLNDEGLLAFCESDFVIIPSGILLRHISGKPVFLHNSTFPHQGMVTCAHCSAPRRMNGSRYEPVAIMTHYESEFGAAPKVEVPPGQEVTFIDPEYSTGRWVGFKGTVESNPCYAVCRSQQDVVIQGKWKKLLKEVRDSHWMMVYGDYLDEVGYAARKMGIVWESLAET